MNPKQKKLVQETWMQVAPIADQAAELFYARLFELDPSIKPMFANSDMKSQGKMLMTTLGLAVKGLDQLDQLVPALENLGRRHTGYGVQDHHYDTVGAAFLWTLEKGLGAAFTPPVKDAWAAVYGVMAGVMKNAARKKAA